MKLLIVDDSLIVRRAIERTLSRTRFTEIRSASNGRLGLEEFERFEPDVVTMDITMPEMDGLAAVDAMIRLRPSTVILVISALADKSTAVESIRRGASGFLLKPITAEAVQEAMDEALSD